MKCPLCNSCDIQEVRAKLTEVDGWDVVDYCYKCQCVILDEHDLIEAEDIAEVEPLH
jgi:Zn-finger nucleic acid-binding protein